jgi:hypothetical protein
MFFIVDGYCIGSHGIGFDKVNINQGYMTPECEGWL